MGGAIQNSAAQPSVALQGNLEPICQCCTSALMESHTCSCTRGILSSVAGSVSNPSPYSAQAV
eukprot:992553-Amphidinium_carterae.1